MEFKNYNILLLVLICSAFVKAQIPSNVYVYSKKDNGTSTHHKLKIDAHYFVHTTYQKSPAKFIKTVGGFIQVTNDVLEVALEFNSAYEQDSIRTLSIPYTLKNENLILEMPSKMVFKPKAKKTQDLDGKWLFATRGPDVGQKRRGEEAPRKTMKFLMGDYFQWIAYHTETMKFSGTGGGTFTSKDGIYTEHIEFFSRDNTRVGAVLGFKYELQGNDWHHTGKNSKGAPMYEIWARRE